MKLPLWSVTAGRTHDALAEYTVAAATEAGALNRSAERVFRIRGLECVRLAVGDYYAVATPRTLCQLPMIVITRCERITEPKP